MLGCLLATFDGRAEPAAPDSSRIVEIYPTERGPAGDDAAARLIDPSGYLRADMIVGIYDGQFELVPAGGLDNLRYFAQAVADLRPNARTWSWSAPSSRSSPTSWRARSI